MNTIDDSLSRANTLQVDVGHPIIHDGLYYVPAYYAVLVIKAVNPGREICQRYKFPDKVRRVVWHDQPRRYLYCLADCLALRIRVRRNEGDT